MSSASSQKNNKSLNTNAILGSSPTPDSASTPDITATDLETATLSENNAVPLESGIAHFLRQLAQPQPAQPPITPQDTSPITEDEEPKNEEPKDEKPSVEPPTTNDFGQLGFAGVDIRQLAAEGYFQAIAYWLNEPLIPQQVYAQVLADDVPGRIKVLIEFERTPQPQRLIRFVCDRLYKLNSDIIEGVHLIARTLGAAKTDWEKSIRIPTATQRQQKRPNSPTPPRPTPPRPTPHAPNLLHESTRIHIARQAVRSQFKFFRAALVTGTAAAAFLFGGFTELVLSEKLSAPATQNANITPWYGNEAADFSQTGEFDQYTQPNPLLSATNVSFRPASRFQGRVVEAALETVAVSPHDDVENPSDPTITLLFGGELNLNHFNFAENEDLDNLFSEIDIYQQADIAMVGLGEPLANASTSLQEDFYRRTRPQAVKTLKTGGIDIVGLAGEGNLTYGERGLSETLTNLDRQGIYRVGAGRNQQEAHRPEILEVKGQRIAYLGYNPDAAKGAKAEKAGVALATSQDRKHIIEDIKAIRSQVDWIVVNYRWGNPLTPPENTQTESRPHTPTPPRAHTLTPSIPEDWQKSLAYEAVDAGADLVVGYHPKNIQGVEIYHDRAIAYSLGDFVFGESPLQDHDTAALRVSLRNQQMKIEFLPVTIRESKLQMATGEHGAAILQTIRNASRSFEQPMRFPAILDAKPNRYLPASLHQNNPPSLPEEALPASPHSAPETLSESGYNADDYEIPAFDAPAPNPRLQESEALFIPAEDPVPNPDNPTEIIPLEKMVQEEWLSDNDEPQPWQDPWEDESLMDGALSNDELLGNELPENELPGNGHLGNTDLENARPENARPENVPLEGAPLENRLEDGSERYLGNDLENWGEKNTETEPEFEPIPAGTLQRQQPENAPEDLLPQSTPSEEIWFDDLQRNSDAYAEPTHEEAYTAPIREAETTEISSAPHDEAPHETDRFNESAPTSIKIADPPAPGVIAPYEEPLVGPLSALPASHFTTEKSVTLKPITAINNLD